MPINKNSGLGVNQTYKDEKASRAKGVTYYNTTGKPILVHIRAVINATGTQVEMYIDGLAITGGPAYQSGWYASGTFLVPPGSSYQLYSGNVTSIQTWLELKQ